MGLELSKTENPGLEKTAGFANPTYNLYSTQVRPNPHEALQARQPSSCLTISVNKTAEIVIIIRRSKSNGISTTKMFIITQTS